MIFALARRCQAIDGKAQIRQYVVVDDVVEKYRVRVEGVLRQDDTVVKCLVLLADEPVLSNRQHSRYSMLPGANSL